MFGRKNIETGESIFGLAAFFLHIVAYAHAKFWRKGLCSFVGSGFMFLAKQAEL